MNLYLAVLRVVHIFSGVFWVGTIFYFALFFLPRIKRSARTVLIFTLIGMSVARYL